MASASSQVNISTTRDRKTRFRNRAFAAGTAVFLVNVATCTVENIPNLTDKSCVKISERKNASGKKLIEIYASRVNGTNGTITVGTVDGSTASGQATQDFQWTKEEM